MEILLKRELFERYYNCSFYDYNSVPRDQRRNIGPGVSLIVCYILFEILYLPCIGVFARKENRKETCYKLMLFMGVLSMLNIHSSCLLIGIYAVRGDVFCDRPLFNYVMGMSVFALYTAECIVSLILALNRCIEMWSGRLAAKLFDSGRVYFWILGALLYGLAMGFLMIPPMPNGMLVGYFWNPHIGYAQDLEGWYHHKLFPYHNLGMGFGIPIIYTTFFLFMRSKTRSIGDQQTDDQHSKLRRKRNKNVFIQVMLIGLLTMVYSLDYVYMQYFPVPAWFVLAAHYSWSISHGLFAIILIALNKHVRGSISALFIEPTLRRVTRLSRTGRSGASQAGSSVNPQSTMVAPNPNNNGNQQREAVF